MADLVELTADGIVDLGNAVTVEVAPHRGEPVKVSPSLDVLEINPVTIRDDERIFGTIVEHLGEGMPNEASVEVLEAGDFVGSQSRRAMGIRKKGN